MTAPELVGDTWLGTAGERWNLASLRGRIVLLDFWTLCCVNCHHVLAELRPIEEEFANVLTVVGVHSPKFEHEKDPAAVAAAMQRHGITHPVLNDPHMSTWQAYGVRAWPTLVLLDTHGQIAGTFSGEGHGHAIRVTIETLITAAEKDGSLRRGPDRFVPLPPPTSTFLQPGKVTVIGADQLLVSDTGRHRLALASIDDPHRIAAHIGSGERGLRDGIGESAQFNEPYGHAILPEKIATAVGYDVVIADTGNHALRGLRLSDHRVTTIAGTSEQWMRGDAEDGDALTTRLSTPWDVTYADGVVFIAMAGDHRIWTFDPLDATVSVYAGTTQEGLVDGGLMEAWFAQPSALAVSGQDLWVVDAETSALRVITPDDTTGDRSVRTLIGSGLFDFGHADGEAAQALMQHPLGVAVLPDSSVVIADSYNGALRRFDPVRGEVTTIARDLAEPSDVVVLPGAAAVLVVEAATGRLTRVPLEESTQIVGQAMRTIRPALKVAPGEVRVEIVFEPPPGEKRDERYGPSTHLVIGSTPGEMVRSGAGGGVDLTRTIVIVDDVEDGVLHVAAKGASCDDTTDPDAHPTCHIHQQDWGIPLHISPDGQREIRLMLSG